MFKALIKMFLARFLVYFSILYEGPIYFLPCQCGLWRQSTRNIYFIRSICESDLRGGQQGQGVENKSRVLTVHFIETPNRPGQGKIALVAPPLS